MRGQVIELVQVYEGRIVAVAHDALTVCLDGHPDTLDDFEELLRGYGIVELQRSGRIALPKLLKGGRPAARVRRIGRAS